MWGGSAALWPRSRCEVICKLCSKGEVLTASLNSEESWLVALALKGSLSILRRPAHASCIWWLLHPWLPGQQMGNVLVAP